jgi:uncharacterized damage-inducible protein DinB
VKKGFPESMNADDFRQFYEYHFSENGRLWDRCLSLTDEQFARPSDYSRGSVKEQVLHMMSAERYWFGGLSGIEVPGDLDPADFPDRPAIRSRWDEIEGGQRSYLAGLTDEALAAHPCPGTGDEILVCWQVLLHTANHATDHRAQLLRLLNDLGVETNEQDYIFHLFNNA